MNIKQSISAIATTALALLVFAGCARPASPPPVITPMATTAVLHCAEPLPESTSRAPHCARFEWLPSGGVRLAPTFGQANKSIVVPDKLGAQLIITGGSATPSGSAGGDLSGTYPHPSVAKISGSSPIAITPNVLQWLASSTAPTLTQATPTTDVATVPLTITSQAPWASAVTNLSPGILKLVTPAPVGAGVPGYVGFYSGSNFVGALGTDPAAINTFNLLWLTPGITPGASNYTLLAGASSAGTNVNAPGGSINLTISGTQAFGANTTALTSGAPTFQWASAITAPSVTQLALASTSAGSGAAGQAMSVTAQAGQAATGASNNGGAGATLSLSGGVGGTSGSATAGKGGAVAIGSSMLLHETTLNASTYTVDTSTTTGDLIILDKYPSTGASAVTLPAVVAGRVVIITDASGAAATHNITITPASGTCNGSATCVISTNYASDRLISDGTNWFTFFAVEGAPEDWAAWGAANDNAETSKRAVGW